MVSVTRFELVTSCHNDSWTYVKNQKTARSMRNIPIGQALADLPAERREAASAERSASEIQLPNEMYVESGIGDSVSYAYMDPYFLWQSWKAIAGPLDLKGTQGKVLTFHNYCYTHDASCNRQRNRC